MFKRKFPFHQDFGNMVASGCSYGVFTLRCRGVCCKLWIKLNMCAYPSRMKSLLHAGSGLYFLFSAPSNKGNGNTRYIFQKCSGNWFAACMLAESFSHIVAFNYFATCALPCWKEVNHVNLLMLKITQCESIKLEGPTGTSIRFAEFKVFFF